MDKKVFAKKLGKRIAAKRKEKKMTQVQLAVLLGLPKQNINRLEKGEVNPSFFFICQLAEGLKIDINDLIP